MDQARLFLLDTSLVMPENALTEQDAPHCTYSILTVSTRLRASWLRISNTFLVKCSRKSSATPETGHGITLNSTLLLRAHSTIIWRRTWLSLTVFLVCTIHAGQCRCLGELAALSISSSAPPASTVNKLYRKCSSKPKTPPAHIR